MTRSILENYDEFERNFAEHRTNFFNCFSKEEQLLVFCEVVSRLNKAELEDRKTIRGVLYDEFGFDADAYEKAQASEFLELHNSIDAEQLNLIDFAVNLLKLYGIEQTKDQVEKKIKQKISETASDDT